MGYLIKKVVFLFVLAMFSASCATIVGGGSYNAVVKVEGHPSAKIAYRNSNIGVGTATLPIARKDADKVNFTVSKDGCPTQEYNFTTRQFRGWAFFGSLMLMPIVNGIPVPITTIVDFATGSYYKPNRRNPAIYKEDYKNYNYLLPYNCNPNAEEGQENPEPANNESSKEDKLIELKELFDSGMITEEEYKKARTEILNK